MEGISQNIFEQPLDADFPFSFFVSDVAPMAKRVARIEPHRLGYSSDIVPMVYPELIMFEKISYYVSVAVRKCLE